MNRPSLFKRIKNKVRPRWVKIVRKLLSARWKLGVVTREFGFRPISGNPLASRKTSDTLFILGSGASINSLTPEEWQEIAAHDTLGFNFWLVHDFVPKTFMFEPPDEGTPDFDCMAANLSARADDLCDSTIVIKDGERHHLPVLRRCLAAIPRSLHRNITMALDWEPPEENIHAFAAKLRLLERFNMVSGERMPVLRKRGSVFYAVILGLRAGYRNIVLCGVDLNNADYFYESLRDELTGKGRFVPLPRPLGLVHKTDNPDFGSVTISAALDALDREVLALHGVRLMVAFRSSRLHPRFESYFRR